MNTQRNETPRRRCTRACAGAMIVLVACVANFGCGRKAPNYIPSSKTSRASLEAALTAWVNGQRVGSIPNVSPPIQVVDSVWFKGQHLAGYEIVSEETTKDGLPCFSVRLHKSKPYGDETVRYLVAGRSPVWIYREEDYKRSQSWEGYQ